MKRYRRKSNGDTVYEFLGIDYGLANDDTRLTGVPHVSVTRDIHGGPPSFTVEESDLEDIT